jgi:hypothetical protein
MLILMAATSTVVYQKTKSDRVHPNRIDGSHMFHGNPDKQGYVANIEPHDFQITEKDRADFVSIILVGGGAAGAESENGKGGSAGEVVNFNIPSMNGAYRVILGSPGTIGANRNGGTTALYRCEGNYTADTSADADGQMNCNANSGGVGWRLIKSARGGNANNEVDVDPNDGVDETVGEQTSDENGAGFGGNANSNGAMGAAYISW